MHMHMRMHMYMYVYMYMYMILGSIEPGEKTGLRLSPTPST